MKKSEYEKFNNVTLVPLSVEQIKKGTLTVLKYFKNFCLLHRLSYYITSGTLLGAVRHGGYIPWDDDIDVVMLRKDYDLFLQEFKNEHSEDYILTGEDVGVPNQTCATKLSQASTVLMYRDNMAEYGLHIDIFPLDSLGESEEEAEETLKDFRKLLKIRSFSVRKSVHFKGMNPIKAFAKYLWYRMSKIYSIKRANRNLNKKLQKLSRKKDAFVGCVTLDAANREIMPGEIYASASIVKFEDDEFTACNHPDLYLRRFYGDYLKLPPENMRTCTHGFLAFVKE